MGKPLNENNNLSEDEETKRFIERYRNDLSAMSPQELSDEAKMVLEEDWESNDYAWLQMRLLREELDRRSKTNLEESEDDLTETDLESQLVELPQAVTRTEQLAIDQLVRSGADPIKARNFVIEARQSGLNVSDLDYSEIVEEQLLRPDSHFIALADQQELKDYVTQWVTTQQDIPVDVASQWGVEALRKFTNQQDAEDFIQAKLAEYKSNQTAEALKYLGKVLSEDTLSTKEIELIAQLRPTSIKEAKEMVRQIKESEAQRRFRQVYGSSGDIKKRLKNLRGGV